MSTETRLNTFPEFAALIDQNQDQHFFESIDTDIIEKISLPKHGALAAHIAGLLFLYAAQNKSRRAASQTSHEMPLRKSNAVQPDVSFYLDPAAVELSRMPDLAVEIKSPGNTYLGLRDEAAYMIKNGTKMVWLVFSEKNIVEVYTPMCDVDILIGADTLSGGNLLPGFTVSLSDLFALNA